MEQNTSTESTESTESTFTPAEQAYFSSRGSDMTAWEAPEKAPEPAEPAKPSEEEAPEAETAPEPAEPVAEAPEKKEKQSTVPLAALHEEREARKRAEKAYQELMETLNKRFAEPEKEPEEPKGPPSPEDDIFEAVKYTQEQLKAIREAQEESKRREQQAASYQQFYQTTRTAEQEFAAKVPDYNDALGHLRTLRVQELQAFGVTDAQAIERDIAQQAQAIAAHALRMGKNPGELAYALAKTRGYQPKVTAAVSQVDKAEAKAASMSLSKGGGSSPAGEVSVERVLKMSDEEFIEWKAKNPAKWRKMASQ